MALLLMKALEPYTPWFYEAIGQLGNERLSYCTSGICDEIST